MVSGKVTGTSPLTITLDDGLSLTVKLSPAAKVTQITTESLSDIKSGDRIVASGRPGDDGNLSVGRIAVNIDAPMGPMGPMGAPGFGPPDGGR